MSPAGTGDDIQAAKELANLLGRELVQARKRVTKLEEQVQESKKKLNQSKTKSLSKPADRAPNVVLELRREIDRYKQEGDRLKQTVDQLNAECQNVMNKEKEIRALRNEVTTLKAQRKAARGEARKAKEACEELGRRAKELEESLKELERPGEGRERSDDAFSVISSLPLCPARPVHGSLVPVAEKGIRLREYLLSDPSTQPYADAVLFFPGRFTWCTTSQVYHHALAFGPTHIFNTQYRRWEKRSTMESLCGQIRELFYEDRRNIFYAGTYRCVRLRKPFIDWPDSEVEGLTSYAMAETALSEDFSNAPCSQAHKGTISKLYREGVLKLECMGLQCVGFKEKLYKDLVARYQSSSPSKGKRRPDSTEEERTKKRRTK